MKSIYLFSLTKVEDKDITHIQSLDIEYFPQKIDFDFYDYLIFTSKQAITYLLTYHDKQEFLSKKALCVSKKTQKFYKSIGGDVLKSKKNYSNELVDIIKGYDKKTKWLFLRGEEVALDFTTILKNRSFKIDEKVVYKTSCSKNILDANIKDESVIIFTSPSAVKCFFQNRKISSSNKIIAIGKTTAKALPKGIDFVLPDVPDITKCIKLAKELAKT